MWVKVEPGLSRLLMASQAAQRGVTGDAKTHGSFRDVLAFSKRSLYFHCQVAREDKDRWYKTIPALLTAGWTEEK